MDERKDKMIIVIFGVLIAVTLIGAVAFFFLGIFAGPRIGTVVTPAVPTRTSEGAGGNETAVENEDPISALQLSLRDDEADSFAGLWLQHEPEYRVVVAFTGNGEETIQKYVPAGSQLDRLIEVRPARYTYSQLKSDHQKLLAILDRIRHPVSVGILVQDNLIELSVTDRAAFEAALAAADATLPESVVVVDVYRPAGKTLHSEVVPEEHVPNVTNNQPDPTGEQAGWALHLLPD